MHDIETGPLDAVTFLVGEHQTVETLFVEYEGLSGTSTPDRRRSLVDRMIGEMRIHAAMEEQSFYPSVREMVAEGDSLVEEGLEEHAEAKEALAELEKMSEQDPAFDAKVESMISDMRHHVNEEENEVLPKLRHAVGESWLVELGQELRRTKERLAAEGVQDEATTKPAQPLPPVLTPAGPPSVRRAARTRTSPKRSTTAKKSTTPRRPVARGEAGRHPSFQHARQEVRRCCPGQGACPQTEAGPAHRAQGGRKDPPGVHVRSGSPPNSRLGGRARRYSD